MLKINGEISPYPEFFPSSNQPPNINIQKPKCNNKMDKSSYLAEIANIISGFKEIDVAYLFGSFLEKDEFNDVDVALLLSEELGPNLKEVKE